MNKRTFLLLLALVPFIAITNATAKTKITYKGKKVKVKDFYKEAEKNRQYDIKFEGKELKWLTSKKILELYKQNKKQAKIKRKKNIEQAKKIHEQTKKHAKTSYKNTARTTQTKKLRKKTEKQARTLYKEKKKAAKKLYKKTKESFGLC